MSETSVTKADIDSAGKKLDEFQGVLNDREWAVIFMLFELGARAFAAQWKSKSPGTPTSSPKSSNPPLSTGFLNAFQGGVGTDFKIRRDGEAESVGIGVVWD